ncbi:DUF1158 family protein [Shigella boydii]|nr:DUF1158 family protein [Shigella boydii]MDS1504169.1 DUF1158 family protein [Shigella boydii]
MCPEPTEIWCWFISSNFVGIPQPALGLTLAQKLVTTFHLMDLSQLYTLLFCLWFLVLGAIEYFVLRFIWRRCFSLAD